MKTITGKVISNKMKQTIVVEVESFVRHPKYPKRIRANRKYHAHDASGAKIGDMVTLVETKPFSKTKYWEVQK